MKNILIILMSSIVILSCSDSKDEKTQEEKEQARIQNIINMFVGKWQVSRTAKDIDFNNIVEFKRKDCDEDSYIEFFPDLKAISTIGCAEENRKHQYGSFEILISDDKEYINLTDVSIPLVSLTLIGGRRPIITITSNIFVLFTYDAAGINYLEMKRIN